MPGHLSPLPSVNVKLPNCGITHQAASVLRRQTNHCWHSSHLNIDQFGFQSLFVLASYITNAMLKDVGGAGK